MDEKTQRPKRRDGAISSLNVASDVMSIAKEALSMAPAKAAFGSVGIILTMIRVSFLQVYVGQPQTDVRRTP